MDLQPAAPLLTPSEAKARLRAWAMEHDHRQGARWLRPGQLAAGATIGAIAARMLMRPRRSGSGFRMVALAALLPAARWAAFAAVKALMNRRRG